MSTEVKNATSIQRKTNGHHQETWLGPHARFRIYTRGESYLSVLRAMVFGRVNTGDETTVLEAAISERLGGLHACCVPRARTGIYLVLRTLLRPGQEVILSPYTIVDVVNMVICAGGVPIFADIERDTCNIDPEEISRLVNSNTGAVLVTHLHGLACDLHRISAICQKYGVPLVEDAAQAFGTRFAGQPVGSFGDAAVFSFGMYKNVNAFNGGMVVTGRRDLSEAIRNDLRKWPCESQVALAKRVISGFLRDVATHPLVFRTIVHQIIRSGHCHDIHAINRLVTSELDLSRKDHLPTAYMRRLTDLQARLVLSQLDNVDSDNAARIAAAERYREGLVDLRELTLPPVLPDGTHIYTYFPVQYHDRAALYDWLIRHGRDVGLQHLKNCADLSSFSAGTQDCPRARETASQVVLLPTYPRYPKSEVERNIDCIRQFFRGSR